MVELNNRQYYNWGRIYINESNVFVFPRHSDNTIVTNYCTDLYQTIYVSRKRKGKNK